MKNANERRKIWRFLLKLTSELPSQTLLHMVEFCNVVELWCYLLPKLESCDWKVPIVIVYVVEGNHFPNFAKIKTKKD